VERLAELAPRIPGILDPGDASPALPPPSGLAGEDELDPDELTPAT
jgi:hypothetical protein